MSNRIKSIRLIPAIAPILASKTEQGQYRLGIKSLCISLGVSHTGQIQRIRHSPDLAAALVYQAIDTPGGQQRIALLEMWGVALWAAISIKLRSNYASLGDTPPHENDTQAGKTGILIRCAILPLDC